MTQTTFWKPLTIAALLLAASAVPARASNITLGDLTVDEAYDIDDPLHGYCGTSYATSPCVDNGVLTPFNPADIAGGFSFASDPKSLTGASWLIAILVPNTVVGYGSQTFTVNETAGSNNTAKSVTAVKVSTNWTSGDLANYLGLTSSKPANPFNAFAQIADAGVTAFAVYVANLGSVTLYNQPNAISPPQPLLTLSGSPISTGLEITSFLTSTSVTCGATGCPGGGKTIGTPPSSVLQAQGTTTVPEPATAMMLALGIGACVARRRKLAA